MKFKDELSRKFRQELFQDSSESESSRKTKSTEMLMNHHTMSMAHESQETHHKQLNHLNKDLKQQASK